MLGRKREREIEGRKNIPLRSREIGQKKRARGNPETSATAVYTFTKKEEGRKYTHTAAVNERERAAIPPGDGSLVTSSFSFEKPKKLQAAFGS